MQSKLSRRAVAVAVAVLSYIANGGKITICPARTYSTSARAKLAYAKPASPAMRRAYAMRLANEQSAH